jgi:tetratricopeptide (TPR) repeat protein
MATKLADTVAALEEDSSSFEKWLMLGNLRNQIQDYVGAEEIYEYLTIVKTDSSVPFVNIGNVNHYHLKDFEKAEENYLKAIEISPNEETAYIELHTLYRNEYKTDTNRAEQILKEGLITKPESTNFMRLLANYYRDLGEEELQLEYLNKALNEATRTGDTALMERLNTEISDI